MTTGSQIEVLDLRHFSAAQLRPLLLDEAARWERRLNWDYGTSTELLLEYLEGRILPGFAALHLGRIVGYAFSVLESAKAVIGDVYALNECEGIENPICDRLLHHLIEMLQATPGVDRIEAQLMMFPVGSLAQPLLSRGFHGFSRLYMQRDFSHTESASAQAKPPEGLLLLGWRPEFYEAAAELIHRAYSGHVDSGINDQYRSVQGSLRFLHNVIRFPGCGTFQADNSWVLLEEQSGALRGLLLSSRIRHDIGHVTQLCVAPDLHGLGLGRLLMAKCAGELKRRGGSALSLTVTEANTTALRLYKDLGFRTLQRFEAMVWDAVPAIPRGNSVLPA